ncbi:Hypothetical Protein FCC1311_074572 [Hondaea fermentalgiana]|uniref:Uncharacterized protein n=1 Tax=Hondaea fermentalgiana TaxID=2315210 RepID=A0A2R5GK03_9STRA|nr:Hypothetical Protein FCC1311_074572 [Hondaea fermentalgiana]|eukprot:GBG31236.1 Hypothetical Protein FCC1311_074572 [Hondaea fermentalgiana]
MGRLRSLVLGSLVGGGAYVAMDAYVMSHLSQMDVGLRSLRHDINPDGAPPARKRPAAEDTLFSPYIDQAAASFRRNWNAALRSGYEKFVETVRNPYLNAATTTTSHPSADNALAQPSSGDAVEAVAPVPSAPESSSA